MSAQPLQHPTGFTPSEISALVNHDVVSQHAEEAAFLWTMRSRAVGEPHYSLKELAGVDERVEAHLAGLHNSGDVGWKYAKANLESLGPGEVFALSVMAFGAADRGRMSEALHAGCSRPGANAGLVSALGWLDFGTAAPWIQRLLEAKSPAHRVVGIAASAIHRQDPGPALTAALSDHDSPLSIRALRAVGELKRHDLTGQVRVQLRAHDEARRFWAAWALCLNGEREGLPELTRWFRRSDSFGFRALQLALRLMRLDESRAWISDLAKEPERARFAVMGAGVVCDPKSVPWLIRQMENPEVARLAGEAFTMITGVDLAYHDLVQESPSSDEGDDESVEEVFTLDYESNLPWPSPKLVEQWWEKNQNAFFAGTRYLLGEPITRRSMLDVLGRGKQRQRAAAALELALLDPARTLFEVRAPASRQQRELAAWIS